MARKRATSARERVLEPEDAGQLRLRRSVAPQGPERIAWSYLAAVIALVIVGLGFAVADGVEPAVCNADDVGCTVGVYIIGSLLSALVGAAVGGWVLRLGWEWWLVMTALLVTMPAALDLVGASAWALVIIAPALAALATLGGPDRWARRPLLIGALAGGWILIMLLVIFVL